MTTSPEQLFVLAVCNFLGYLCTINVRLSLCSQCLLQLGAVFLQGVFGHPLKLSEIKQHTKFLLHLSKCLKSVIWEQSQQQCWRMSPQASSGHHSSFRATTQTSPKRIVGSGVIPLYNMRTKPTRHKAMKMGQSIKQKKHKKQKRVACCIYEGRRGKLVQVLTDGISIYHREKNVLYLALDMAAILFVVFIYILLSWNNPNSFSLIHKDRCIVRDFP